MNSKAPRIPPLPRPPPSKNPLNTRSWPASSTNLALREARGRIYFSEEKEDVVRTELGEKRVAGHLTALRDL
jgi:hypothetical protein